MPGLELTFLGTGNAFAPDRYWSSFVLNRRILFDAPPTLLAHLKRLGIDPREIDTVFVSHFHGDHYFGLPFLLLEYAELARRGRDLTIVGPPGIARRVEALTDLAFSSVFRKDRGYELHFIEASDGQSAEAPGCSYTAHRMQHAPSLSAFGYRVTVDGRAVAYTGDTTMCDALLPLATGADVLVTECSCWSGDCGGVHMTARDILALRERVDARTAIVLTHLESGSPPRALIDAGIIIAEDFGTLTF
jgi:ribonuclease BN (tRNA processing enzyme)